MKKFTILFLLLMLIGIATADLYTIGTGTSTQSYVPLYGLYDYSWSKVIYTATELSAAGLTAGPIDGIGFEVGNTPTNYVSADQRVYVRHTTTAAYETTDNALPDNAAFQNVYNADYTWNGGGWSYIMFSSAFNWDGTSNIEISWENWDGDYVSGYPNFRYTSTTPAYLAVYKYADNAFPGEATGTRYYNRPNIQIVTPSTTAPNAAVLGGPVDGSTLNTPIVNLSWSPGNGGLPTGYKLYLGTTTPPAFVADLGAVASYTASDLDYETIYYWQVVPYNVIGDATDCPVWSFTTMDNPVISSFPWTEDFGTVSGDWPVLNWTQRSGLYPDPTGTSVQWVRDEWLNGPTGNNAAKINIYGTSRYGWLITPPIAIPATGYELMFDLGLTRYGNANAVDPAQQMDDRFIVAISDSPDMSNPTLLREWNNSGSANVFNDIPNTGTMVIVNLDAYAGTKYIAFYGESTVSGGDNDLFVDNVTVREQAAGPILSVTPDAWDFGTQIVNTVHSKAFTLTNTGSGSLNISSLNVTGTGFALAEAFVPVALLSGESASFTANFAPQSAGTYTGNVVINDNRAVTNIALSGECFDPTITTLPYSQSFDDAIVPALPLGWSSLSVSGGTAGWASYGSNSNSAPNSASIGYNSSLPLDDWLMSPPINFVGGTTYSLSFYYRGGSTSYVEKLKVMLGTSNQIADFTTQVFIDENINFTDYTRAFVSFTPPSTGTYFLGWHAYSIANQLRMYVDDISIGIPAPVPPLPAEVIWPASGITTLMNPILEWAPSIAGEPASNYKVYMNEVGTFTEADLVYEGLDNTYPTTNLSYGTMYYWKVVPINAHGSDPACPTWTFNTPTTTQIAEGFEATAFPPVGWANGSTGNWTRSTSTPLFEGTASAYKSTSTSVVYVLSTPMLDVTETSTIEFHTRASNISQVLQVVYSTDRETWTQIGANVTYAATGIWYPISIDLSTLAGSSYYFGLRTPIQTTSGSIYVDHVVGPEITPNLPGAPTLVAPADAAINQSVAPLLTWTAATAGGVPAAYNIYLDTTDGSTLIGTSTTTSYTPTTALNWNTTYYWKVTASNNAGESVASDVRSFTTMADITVYTLPFTEGFETNNTNNTAILGWSQEGIAGSNEWTANNTETTYNRSPRTGEWNAYLRWGNTRWMFKPVQFAAGEEYKVSLYARQDGATASNASVGISYGTEPSAAGMTNVILAPTGIINQEYQLLEGTFTPATAGIYYVGIIGQINSSPWYISIDDIVIESTSVSTVNVTGTILAGDTGAGLAGASITLVGDETYTGTSIANGTFTIANVAPNHSYLYTITAEGYEPASGNINVLAVDYSMGNITLAEITLPPNAVVAAQSADFQSVNLSWQAPGAGGDSFEDDFESYANFAMEFGDWTTIDVDGSGTYGLTNTTWLNIYEPMAYMVFNPSATVPPVATAEPHSGNKFAASFAATTPPNNDWLITPQVMGGGQVSFWGRTFHPDYGLEQFKVGVSTTGTAPANFTIISGAASVQAPLVWTEFVYDLSAYAGQQIYVGIQCVSNDRFIFMVDDFYVGDTRIRTVSDAKQSSASDVPAYKMGPLEQRIAGIPSPVKTLVNPAPRNSTRALTGYKVYRLLAADQDNEANWTSLTPAAITAQTYVDAEWDTLPYDTYKWAVKAMYSGGAMSEPAFSNALAKIVMNGNIVGTVTKANGLPLAGATITATGGFTATSSTAGTYSMSVPIGTYSVTASFGTFDPLTHDNITVTANQNTTVNFDMNYVSNEDEIIAITATALNGNYPNPFNPTTTIRYELKDASNVRLDVYNVKGQLVRSLVNTDQAAGAYRVVFNGRDDKGNPLSSGLYLYRFTAGKYRSTRKMMLME